MNYSDWEQRQMDCCDPTSRTYAADLSAAYAAAREDTSAAVEIAADDLRMRMARRQQRARHLPGGEQYDADLARDAVEPFEPEEAA